MRLSAPQRTAELIRQHLLFSSAAKVGDRLPKVQELARRYGVSVPTVSKALAQLQEEGLITSSRGAGTFIRVLPEAKGREPVNRERTLGFISNAFAPAVAQRILAGVTQTASLHGCRVELAITNWNPKEERWHYENMARRGLDGLIVYPSVAAAGEPHYLGELYPDFPTVVIDLARPEMRRPSIVFDNWKAGMDMTRYLLEQGHRRIAFITLGDSRSVGDRFEGYQRALAGAGIPFREEYIRDGREFLSSRNFGGLAEHLMGLNEPPTAIVAAYDQFAVRLIEALEARGYSIPEDLVVTGFDNIQTEEWSHRFPTTAPDFFSLGERAVDLILKIIDTHISTPEEIVLPVPLEIPREFLQAISLNTPRNY